MSRRLREIADPFVAAPPAGARVRTRLRVSLQDAEVLRAVGRHLGELAGRDLAGRCAEGRLGPKQQAESRRERKRALTAASSSRWAGTITRESEDAWQLADRNLSAERTSLASRVRKIEKRLAVQTGIRKGRTAGYANPNERYLKSIRLKALRARLARVEARIGSGSVSVTRGTRKLLRARLSLEDAGLTRQEWRRRWESARLFLKADGETGKYLGNETLRWRPPARPAPSLGELRTSPVLAVDLNDGHLAVAVVAPDGNGAGQPLTIPLPLAGLPATARDGRIRAAVTQLINAAREHGARAVVIENLDFKEAREQGRERTGSRPSRGRRGRAFRRMVAGIPTARFRDRLVQMTANADLSVVAVDPAYSSRWGAAYWLASLREHHPETTGHHAAALVLGRRSQGHRARRRATRNRTAPADAVRPAQARPRKPPVAKTAKRKPAGPRDKRQPSGGKTGPPHRTTTGNQAPEDRSRAPTGQDSLLRGD